jgi:hypothetical protein
LIVSSRLSPLRSDEEAVEKPRTSAERRRAATSNEDLVLVEGSEKRKARMRPDRSFAVLDFLKEEAASRIVSISLALRSRSPSRSFRFQLVASARPSRPVFRGPSH